MNINIFGVGRSGTKVTQLFAAYLLAKEFDFIRLNYEPYFWSSRQTLIPNLKGLKYHLTSPNFSSYSKNFDTSHYDYLNNLVSKNIPTVTKFIRGNGRIDAINEIMKPNFNIIIIRDIYEVLSSIANMDWNFYSNGSQYFQRLYFDSWDSLVNEIFENNLVKDKTILKSLESQVYKNAFYWYIMNIAALKSKSKNSYFINYKNLHHLEVLLPKLLGIQQSEEKISNDLFRGKNISTDNIFSEQKRTSLKVENLKYNINQLLLMFTPKQNLKYIPLLNQQCGSIISLNKNVIAEVQEASKFNEKLISIQSNSFFDDLNSEIFDLLNQIEYQP